MLDAHDNEASVAVTSMKVGSDDGDLRDLDRGEIAYNAQDRQASKAAVYSLP
jgi:hypothetical protein